MLPCMAAAPAVVAACPGRGRERRPCGSVGGRPQAATLRGETRALGACPALTGGPGGKSSTRRPGRLQGPAPPSRARRSSPRSQRRTRRSRGPPEDGPVAPSLAGLGRALEAAARLPSAIRAIAKLILKHGRQRLAEEHPPGAHQPAYVCTADSGVPRRSWQDGGPQPFRPKPRESRPGPADSFGSGLRRGGPASSNFLHLASTPGDLRRQALEAMAGPPWGAKDFFCTCTHFSSRAAFWRWRCRVWSAVPGRPPQRTGRDETGRPPPAKAGCRRSTAWGFVRGPRLGPGLNGARPGCSGKAQCRRGTAGGDAAGGGAGAHPEEGQRGGVDPKRGRCRAGHPGGRAGGGRRGHRGGPRHGRRLVLSQWPRPAADDSCRAWPDPTGPPRRLGPAAARLVVGGGRKLPGLPVAEQGATGKQGQRRADRCRGEGTAGAGRSTLWALGPCSSAMDP